MERIVHAIVLEKETLFDGSQRIYAFSLEEGKLLIHLNSKRPLPEPALYFFVLNFKGLGIAACSEYEPIETFSHEALFLHLNALPVFRYFPLAEPSRFVFGRYLHSLRMCKSMNAAKLYLTWFLASVLFKEGLMPKNDAVKDFIISKRRPNLKEIWKLVKRGLREIEGKG